MGWWGALLWMWKSLGLCPIGVLFLGSLILGLYIVKRVLCISNSLLLIARLWIHEYCILPSWERPYFLQTTEDHNSLRFSRRSNRLAWLRIRSSLILEHNWRFVQLVGCLLHSCWHSWLSGRGHLHCVIQCFILRMEGERVPIKIKLQTVPLSIHITCAPF